MCTRCVLCIITILCHIIVIINIFQIYFWNHIKCKTQKSIVRRLVTQRTETLALLNFKYIYIYIWKYVYHFISNRVFCSQFRNWGIIAQFPHTRRTVVYENEVCLHAILIRNTSISCISLFNTPSLIDGFIHVGFCNVFFFLSSFLLNKSVFFIGVDKTHTSLCFRAIQQINMPLNVSIAHRVDSKICILFVWFDSLPYSVRKREFQFIWFKKES